MTVTITKCLLINIFGGPLKASNYGGYCRHNTPAKILGLEKCRTNLYDGTCAGRFDHKWKSHPSKQTVVD